MTVETGDRPTAAALTSVPAVPRARARSAARGQHLTREERRTRGKAAREQLPRSALSTWTEPGDRVDPVSILAAQSADRIAELVPHRHGRMLVSPFAFYRGGAAVMATDLATTPTTGIGVQVCGDAHLSNFGGYAAPDRNLVFDLNDFDETIPGPWEWDMKRLAASIAIVGRERRFSRSARQGMVLAAAEAYRTGMREFADMSNLEVWYARLTVADVVTRWGGRLDARTMRSFAQRMHKAMTKDSTSAAVKLTRLVDGERRMLSDPPLVTPIADLMDGRERAATEKAVRGGLRAYLRSLAGDRRHLLDQYRYVDMARKVVGVGSVGTRAWVVLLRGVDDNDHLMLQLKEARESVLAPFVGTNRYANQGQRVVEGQRLMQASSDIFLGWSRGRVIDDTSRDFYVRQLWDWKVSPDVERGTVASLTILAEMCGWTVARAHARSGDRVAIAAYLGGSPAFDRAMARFAESYADRNERDYALFERAVASGRIEAAPAV
jgi:uncharacterized protein (DUF2252 family)